jgi:hypothetical protein
MSAFDKMPTPGKHFRYRDLVYWPQAGTICIDDTRDNSFVVVTVQDFKMRIVMFRTLLERSTHKYSDERNEDWNFFLNATSCVKEAERQGDPFDPAVLASFYRHRRRSYIFTGDGGAAPQQATLGAMPSDYVSAQHALLPPRPVPSHNRPPLPAIIPDCGGQGPPRRILSI